MTSLLYTHILQPLSNFMGKPVQDWQKVPCRSAQIKIIDNTDCEDLYRGHDVFNALDILENKTFLKSLKFGVGDGKLRYYLYNWRLKAELDSSDVGLVLL